MSRLIDADALPVQKAYIVDEAGWGANFYVVDKRDIDEAPTVGAVEVVRCIDCKFEGKEDDCPLLSVVSYTQLDDYCSFGERKENA